jgi:hypothetical protein
MSRVKTLLIVVLLLSYGAVGARQPAVRGRLPLPVPARAIADALGLPAPHASTLLLDITRLVYETDKLDDPRVRRMRLSLRNVLSTGGVQTTDAVPLPLDPAIWRDTILQQQVSDQMMVAAIAGDRRGSLIYHGLSALDDETLAWLGPDRETLLQLRNHAGTFAVFGRSLHVRAGRVVVPGGEPAEPLWESIVGASVAKPSAFVQHLFKDDRAAFFYDSMAHLDTARQHFALGLYLPESPRKDRFIALFQVFQDTSPEWRPDVLPFWRPLLDPGLVLSTLSLTDVSLPAGPMGRRLWDRVFRGDETIDVPFSPIDPRDADGDEPAPSDAAGITGRISRPAYTIGRRRLDTMLFAQRVFPGRRADEPGVATALRGVVAYPALMLTLERMGVTDPAALARAAERASALDGVRVEATKRTAILQFQSALGILERIQRTGLLDAAATELLTTSLMKIEATPERGYEGRLVQWLGTVLVPALPAPSAAATAPLEEALLSAMAGGRGTASAAPTIEWEGVRYRVDAASAELARLRRVRTGQGGLSLDAAVAQAADGGDQAAAEALTSILYAAYLGDPAGPGVTAGNAALRHDLGIAIVTPGARSGAPWRLPREDFSGRAGWRVRGSLLGLDTAMGRLSMRRLDPTSMPDEPKLGAHQRVALSVTGALFNPFAMSDAARDEIAATLGRGRARVAALTADDPAIDRVAREAGLSEWRRMALPWTIANDRDALLDQFSLLEIFWLGAPRGAALRALDAWGASAQPLTGCLCLEMPRARPWEDLAGRVSSGVIATRAADVALRVADAFATLHLPSTLAPGVLAFALQDVTEHARPGYPEDWNEFGRAARDLPLDRITDYVAALASNGPLVPQEDKD